MLVPIIDLFAGPGGLGEGFSALRRKKKPVFKIKLSIEKDEIAHKTLELRAFFREFDDDQIPELYYDYLAQKTTRDTLFKAFVAEADNASQEAWNAELGSPELPDQIVDGTIKSALNGAKEWVLIGGPPCQAYSLVGRSKIIGELGREEFEKDHRHFLYRQYLRIIAEHQPPIFVMENVKGLLSAQINRKRIFEMILSDLTRPIDAIAGRTGGSGGLSYRLVSLVTPKADLGDVAPSDFVVRTEDYGIPQARHRVIILGIRSDQDVTVPMLKEGDDCAIEDVISDLPRLRSGLSKEADSGSGWKNAIAEICQCDWFNDSKINENHRGVMRKLVKEIDDSLERGSDFMAATRRLVPRHREWYSDDRLHGVCNHATRSHIRKDLHRYFFISTFAQVHERSPLLNDFPADLLPAHKNVADALKETKFNDRFRVQRKGRASTTITSHISKDGHYFVHYDPTQCRSLTVREAARIQTFPDNYFFEGPRTEQYHQVGNAVPPLLANQIANIVAEILNPKL